MAGKWRRVLLAGMAASGALTACGQAVDHVQGTALHAKVASSPTVVRNPPPVGSSAYTLNGDAASLIGEQPLTPLQRRSAGNIQMRLFTTPFNTGEQCTPDSTQCVPPWCQSTSLLVAEVSNDAMAAVENGSIIGLAQGSQVSLLDSVVAGKPEGSPVHLVMARVAGDITSVRLAASGGSDETAPVDGLAVLALPGSSDDGTLSVLDSDGRIRGSIKLPQPNTIESQDCAPQPSPLPPPGKQPTDPASAEKAVRAAYTKAFTAVPNDNGYSSLDAVQDGNQLHAALDKLRQNFAQAAASSSVDTGQLVFTDPRTAVLKFTLHYTGGAPYGTHNGTAVFENGTWLVSRDTYCAVLAFGSATCPNS